MSVKTRNEPADGPRELDPKVLDRLLREALSARAARLGVDPASITAPSPGVLIARGLDGSLPRVDYRAYQARELDR